jgi:WD40 repeat protein
MINRSLAGWFIVLSAGMLVGSAAEAQKDKKPPTLAEVKGVANLAYALDGSFVLIDYRPSGGRPDQSQASLGVWDTKTGEFKVGMEKVPQKCDRIAVSPDGKKAAAIDVGDRQLKIWNVATGKVEDEQTLPAWKGSIRSAPFLKFSADSKFLYSIREQQILELKLGEKHRLVGESLNWFGPDLMALDPEAKRLIVVHNIQGQSAADIQVYDLTKEGKPETIRADGHIQSMALSHDGKTLALSFLRGGRDKSRFELWDVPAFKRRSALPADARKGFQYYGSMAFAPDDKALAGAPVFDPRSDTIVDLFDLEGKISHSLTNKSFAVSLTYSPDGKTLAAVLFDNALLLIDPATGEAKKP